VRRRSTRFYRLIQLGTAALLPFGLAWLVACDEGAQPPLAAKALEVRAEDLSEHAIPRRRVEGVLRGSPFRVEEARFRVERMPGRERVDLLLSDKPFVRCGVPVATTARKVWLRFQGKVRVEPGVMRVGPADTAPPFTMHYEARASRKWRGEQGGAALLALHRSDAEAMHGRLHACFDDGRGSCVKGWFRARPCTGELDVDDPVVGAGNLAKVRPAPAREP
jgi:hypothetical protein